MSANAVKNKIDEPFIALTATRLRAAWGESGITAKYYLKCLLELLRPPGVPLRIPSVKQFCKEWGIGESTYYKAVHSLKSEGSLDWRATEGMILWATKTSKVTQLPTATVETDSTIVEDDSTTVETDSTTVETDSTIVEDDSTTVETDSTIVEFKSSETSHSNAFDDSIDHYVDPLIDLSSDQLEREKREGLENSGNTAIATRQGVRSTSPVNASEPNQFSDTNQPIADDISSAPETYSSFESFDWRSFDWGTYQNAGDGGSDPNYWAVSLERVAAIAERRLSNPQANQEPIDDAVAYTLRCIRNRAAEGYENYLIHIGVLPPKPQAKASTRPSKKDKQHSEKLEEWHNRAKRCDQLFADGRTDEAVSILNAVLKGGPSYAPDPQQVEWIISNYSHWGVKLSGDRSSLIVPGGEVDLADVLAKVKLHLKRLKWTAEQEEAHLVKVYRRKATTKLEDQDLVDFLYYLEGVQS